ncbi:MAG: alpha-L-glutamate ligase-like protein [Pseudomonadota bacterium]
MLDAWRKLRDKGVIGVNERNLDFVALRNPRRLLNRVDDKVETKRLADLANIPNPELYGVVRDGRDARALPELLARPDGCVIKPARGSQGKGILVIDGPLQGGWRLANGRRVSGADVRHHVNNILSGMYSLGGQPDAALIEYRVKFDPVFGPICFKGVPDVRVIVLRGVPAFAMLRLPTAESDGKANLHRGGVGVGVDIVTGETRTGMQFDRPITLHPDTAEPLAGIAVPHWDDILTMAARAYDVTELGYLGVDIVLDEEKGPLLLELNARPGLSIQIANQLGMRAHLKSIAGLDLEVATAQMRVRLGKHTFEKSFGGDGAADNEPLTREPPAPKRPILDVVEGGLAGAAA